MKKAVALFLALAVIFLSACSQAQIESIPSGYTSCVEHWDKNKFQDCTDYCKYTYDSKDIFFKSSDYSEIAENDVETINDYCTNFQEWIKTENRLDEYNFNSEYINAGDYVRVVEKEGCMMITAFTFLMLKP